MDDGALVIMVGLPTEESARLLGRLGPDTPAVLVPSRAHARDFLGVADDRASDAPAGQHGAADAAVHRFVRHGRLRLDIDSRLAAWDDTPFRLGGREFDLLARLAEDPGKVWTFASLTRAVWEREFVGDRSAVTSSVKRLRASLRSASVPVTVESVRGRGYRLAN